MDSCQSKIEDGSGFVVGIDASRNRSGGARAHLIGVLSAIDPRDHGVEIVHVWAYKNLLNDLPDKTWLVKHCPNELGGSIFSQLWWQRYKFPKELMSNSCNILLSTDAGTVCRFTPSVVMSRDMLSFEPGEINRYGFSLARLRLILLRYIQVDSLIKATGALFLTEYASNVIQNFTGVLKNYRIIPHGIGDNFRVARENLRSSSGASMITCVYVSNADLYKHQWHVISAVRKLRELGHNIVLELIGGASGMAKEKVEQARQENDPCKRFVKITGAVLHNQIPSYLASADIFIFASSCENMPNTLVEAMASELPIACSSRGPMPEILQGAGEYFDPEKPDSISLAIERLIENKELRNIKSKQAKLLSEKYSWHRCAQETWCYLKDVNFNFYKKII